jgi:hypothetical protein
LLATVKTDENSRYILKSLAAGIYRVTLVVNGALKTSINNTVWIPAFKGSRLPGRWVEVDDGGAWATEASANNIVRVSGEKLQRTIHSLDIKSGQ